MTRSKLTFVRPLLSTLICAHATDISTAHTAISDSRLYSYNIFIPLYVFIYLQPSFFFSKVNNTVSVFNVFFCVLTALLFLNERVHACSYVQPCTYCTIIQLSKHDHQTDAERAELKKLSSYGSYEILIRGRKHIYFLEIIFEAGNNV